jgi:hypothetical protein
MQPVSKRFKKNGLFRLSRNKQDADAHSESGWENGTGRVMLSMATRFPIPPQRNEKHIAKDHRPDLEQVDIPE